MPEDYQIPEMNAAEDALMQAEQAGLLPFDSASVIQDKRDLQAYIQRLDAAVRSCPDLPPAIAADYLSWRKSWQIFYNQNVWPWTVSSDRRSLEGHHTQAVDFHDRLASYCSVPDAPEPPPDTSVAGTARDVAGAIKTAVIVGGVLALVLVVGGAYVASRTIPANIKAGGEFTRGLIRR